MRRQSIQATIEHTCVLYIGALSIFTTLICGCTANLSLGSNAATSPVSSLTTSQSPSPYGATVTFTDALPAGLIGPASVSFFDGESLIGTATSSGGTASFTTSSLAPGTHDVSAKWMTGTFKSPDFTDVVTQVVDMPSVTISTPGTPLLGDTSYALKAIVSGSEDQALQWSVNGIPGGSAAVGTITQSGVYTSPISINSSVQITATLSSYPPAHATTTIQLISPTSSPGTISFAFTLANAAATSAGVYNSSGNLIRTLWSNESLAAGPHVATWDGHDDEGNQQVGGQYQIRVLSNNVTYKWGVIGDTSDDWTALTSWDTQANFPSGMVVIGSTAYVANNYAEGRPNASYFQLSQPNAPSALFTISQCFEAYSVATDGKLLYFANIGNGWAGSASYVMAFDPTAMRSYKFASGQSIPIGQDCGTGTLGGVIDYGPVVYNNAKQLLTNAPTGIAVQTQGNILAVSHGSITSTSPSEDVIRLFDKTTGAAIGNINIANPHGLAFAPDGTLWAITGNSVVHIGSVGQQNVVLASLQQLSSPLAIAVDPTTSDLLVADGGSAQQVKRFSSSGVFISAYGIVGGYTDCNPIVSPERLFLDQTAGAGFSNQNFGPTVLLSALPDGSFWVGDPGNSRILHISYTGNYIEQIAFLRWIYNIAVDHNDPSRVFAGPLEYAVDYTKPLLPGDPDPGLGGNGSWTLVKNWSVCVPPQYGALDSVQTFRNGRTYGEIINNNYSNVSRELVELPQQGPLRFSGQILMSDSNAAELFNHEGDLAYWSVVYSVAAGRQIEYASEKQLIGFDQNNWPVWGASITAPNLLPVSAPNDPWGFGGWDQLSVPQTTENGMLVTYKAQVETPGDDFHLGGLDPNGSGWSWRASPGEDITTPDGKGTFPDNPSCAGNAGISVFVEGSNVFEGFNGNYCPVSSQWMHWSEDGLLIGQFGHIAYGFPPGEGYPAGAAGNIAMMSTVPYQGKIYLYNSDESLHPGVHQWTIDGLNTIKEASAWAEMGATAVLQ